MSRLATQRKKKLTHDNQSNNSTTSDRSIKKLYTGTYDCLRRIIKEEGVGTLWNGVYPSLILVTNPTIQFFVYERCRRFIETIAFKQKRPITALEFFMSGAIAKATATFLTYPLQLAQSQLRTLKRRIQDKTSGDKVTTVSLLSNILATKGILGWFRGFGAKMWQTMLTAAFQFMVKEELVRTIVHTLGGQSG